MDSSHHRCQIFTTWPPTEFSFPTLRRSAAWQSCFSSWPHRQLGALISENLNVAKHAWRKVFRCSFKSVSSSVSPVCIPDTPKKGEEARKKEVLAPIHTHTQGRGNPERQEEQKSGDTVSRRSKTMQGGREQTDLRTNLHSETDLRKTEDT